MPTSASQCHLSRWVPVQSSSTWRPMCFAPLATSSTNPSGLQPTLQPTILCTLCQSSTVHHRTTSSRNSPLNGREAASSSSSTRLGNRAICPTEHRSCAALLGTPVEWFCTILVLHGTHYDMLARTVVTPHGVSTACASPSVLPAQLGAQSQAGNSSEMRPASSRLAHLLRDAPFHAGVCGHGMMLVTEPHDLIVCGAEEESALFCQCCWHLLSVLSIYFPPAASAVHGHQYDPNHRNISVTSTGVSSTGVSFTGSVLQSSTGVSSTGVSSTSESSTGSTNSHMMTVNRLPNDLSFFFLPVLEGTLAGVPVLEGTLPRLIRWEGGIRFQFPFRPSQIHLLVLAIVLNDFGTCTDVPIISRSSLVTNPRLTRWEGEYSFYASAGSDAICCLTHLTCGFTILGLSMLLGASSAFTKSIFALYMIPTCSATLPSVQLPHGSSALPISLSIVAVAVLITISVVSLLLLLDFRTSVRIHFAYQRFCRFTSPPPDPPPMAPGDDDAWSPAGMIDELAQSLGVTEPGSSLSRPVQGLDLLLNIPNAESDAESDAESAAATGVEPGRTHATAAAAGGRPCPKTSRCTWPHGTCRTRADRCAGRTARG